MLTLRRLHIGTNAFLRAAARLRPSWMVSFSIAEADLSEGLRAACASTAMLLVGDHLHNSLFAWAAIGAFWTCLADAAGSSARRFASMASFSLLSTVAGGLTAFASGLGVVAAAVAIMVFVFAAGLSAVFSAPAYQVGILAATACVVMVDHPPHGVTDGVCLLATYFAGCAFATLLSFTVWRIHPFSPARLAIKVVYARLSELARDNARLILAPGIDPAEWARYAADLRPVTRDAIEVARHSIFRVPRSKLEGRKLYKDLSFAVADADRIFEYLLAVSQAAERASSVQAVRQRSARALTTMAEVLSRMGMVLRTREAAYPASLRARLSALSAYLEQIQISELPLEFPPIGEDDVFARTSSARSWARSAMRIFGASLARMRVNMTMSSASVRQAARLTVATSAAFLVTRALHVAYGYWATMATLLVMQPSIGTTWGRGIERAVGSTIGAALAIAIGRFAHTPMTLSLAVFPLVCLTVSSRKVSYGLYVTFLTPTFVLVADFASRADELQYSLARLGDNVVGTLLALFATYLLWPKRDADELRNAMVNAVRANLEYLALSLRGSEVADAERESIRRNAGLTSNILERVYKLVCLEQWRSAGTDSIVKKVAELLRGMAATASSFCVVEQSRPPDRELVAWVSAAAATVKLTGQGVDFPECPPKLRLEELSLLELCLAQQMMRLSDLLEKTSS